MSLLPKLDLSGAVTLCPISMDDISSVRYVHATAFRILAAEHHSEEEIQAHVELIHRNDYAKDLLASDVYAAWVDEEIVGTAGWSPADDNGTTARIRTVFVRPLFTNCGIGSFLVRQAEMRAKRAGFKDFSVRANINSVSFYEKIGYEITSYGVMPTRSKVDLPVAFMRKHEEQVQERSKKLSGGEGASLAQFGVWTH